MYLAGESMTDLMENQREPLQYFSVTSCLELDLF